MEVFLFLTLLNASYDNVSFPSSVSMTGDGQNTGMGAGENRHMAWGFGLLSSCIPCREGLGEYVS
jgi:hypothetical protein